ncbi:MAG: tyrosine-type recombinase/integrase [Hyphomicrobiales bacterium]|nr:tyrosine-type recombinase/integrase [Hyphomicrobiales bacterium]
MTKRNADNERVKRRYLLFLKDAKGRDTASVDAAASAIERFEDYARRRDFRKFHIEQARGFKAHLMAASNERTGKPLTASTVAATLASLKAFFVWLADQPGYASRIKYADAEYFNAPDNLSRIATARRFKSCPTLAQVRAMIDAMPKETEIEKRDRALVAFAILSGARDRAIISFRLKHIDTERDLVEHDARDVRTKRAKTFTTWFFPVGDDIRQIVVDWVKFLREEKGYGLDDPLFPKTKVAPGDDLAFRAVALDRAPWANANPVRQIFREACARAGLPYFNPHLLRNTLVQVAYDLKPDAEAFKAWSQNLGHDSCLTTFSSYGTVPPARQAEILRRLAVDDTFDEVSSQAEMLRKLADQMQRRGSSRPTRAKD